MIVDPDFLDHWRTRMLVDELGGDEFAPFYLLRLWGHCQTRRSTSFEIPAAGLKGLCKASCSAELLESALIKCGYIERDGQAVRVLKWAEKNASLQAAWANGGKGGRPAKKEPDKNPSVSQGEPNENPGKTATEPIREEKRGDSSLRSDTGLFEAPGVVLPAGKPKRAKKAKPSDYTDDFELAWAVYPRRPGDSKKDAFKAWLARLAAGFTAEQMTEGARRYAAFAEVKVSEPTYLKQGATFFGPGEHFMADWAIPKAVPKPVLAVAPPVTVESRAADATAAMLQQQAQHTASKPSPEAREKLALATQRIKVKAASGAA